MGVACSCGDSVGTAVAALTTFIGAFSKLGFRFGGRGFGAVHVFCTHALRRTFVPPKRGLSRQLIHVSQSSFVEQPAQPPHRCRPDPSCRADAHGLVSDGEATGDGEEEVTTDGEAIGHGRRRPGWSIGFAMTVAGDGAPMRCATTSFAGVNGRL